MAFYLKLYALTVPVFFLIDLLWLGLVARSFYREALSHYLAPQTNWPAAIGFYLVYIVGILLFAVLPALEKETWTHAALWGALFGFFTYATYELTNLALAKDWPVKIVVVDILWGTVLCAAVASASYFLGVWLRG